MKHLKKILSCVLFATIVVQTFAQVVEKNPENSSIALQPIKAIGDIPVVYENEVNGGWHQIRGTPWDGDEAITPSRLTEGLLVTNTNTVNNYRYLGDLNDNKKGDETEWQQVFIVSTWDNSKSYKKGRCVIASVFYNETDPNKGIDEEERRIFQATQDVPSSVGTPRDNNEYWECLHQGVSFYDDDATTPTKILVSAGQTIVFIDTNVYLKEISDTSGEKLVFKPEDYKGETFVFKNISDKKNSAVGYTEEEVVITGKIDGKEDAEIFLFNSGKYVKLLSDGTTWHEIGTNRMREFVLYSNDNKPDSNPDKVVDAIYFGNPHEAGCLRIYAYIEKYEIEWYDYEHAGLEDLYVISFEGGSFNFDKIENATHTTSSTTSYFKFGEREGYTPDRDSSHVDIEIIAKVEILDNNNAKPGELIWKEESNGKGVWKFLRGKNDFYFKTD